MKDMEALCGCQAFSEKLSCCPRWAVWGVQQIKDRCKPRPHAGNLAKASWCEYFAQDNQGFIKTSLHQQLKMDSCAV